ncbi:ATP-binding protein [Streptomyces sioyaensis]|uniref:ATP-binding protein n=1 Tax=Streptomyces sioyaensis TaxID=67364 RepID=UPI001F38FA6D|nr:ATP-binding protein [Streptomyces sioyaensis]MCF3175309.1 ATP-binding protein [Streptomyces sioyaensis]
MPQPTTRARPTGHPGYSETLPREPASAATARRLVRAACATWNLVGLADDSALIISELVSNAVQHARRESIRVIIERPGAARMRVGVVDFSKAQPVRKAPGPEGEGGRGLTLVGELAADWGTDPLPWGKQVWAELHEKGEK